MKNKNKRRQKGEPLTRYVYAQKQNLFVPDFEQLDPGTGEDNFIKGISIDKTKAEKKIGFFADVQIERKLQNNWGISASLGVNQVAYSYKTPSFGITTTNPDLNNTLNKMGDVRILYLTSRLANISKKWNRATVTAGPELGYVLHKKYVTTVSWQTEQDEKQYISMIHDGKGDANKLLMGAALGVQYEVGKNFYVRLGGQKILSSLYKKEGTAADVHKKSRPVQVELGIGYRITGF